MTSFPQTGRSYTIAGQRASTTPTPARNGKRDQPKVIPITDSGTEQPELDVYSNSGTVIMNGGFTQAGHLLGNKNGVLNAKPNSKNLAKLLDKTFSPDGGKSDVAKPHSSSSDTPGSGKFKNTGTHKMKGIFAQIGFTDGDGNGEMNLE